MEPSLRAALNGHLLAIVRPFAWSIGGVYGLLALSWTFGPRANVPLLVVLLWTLTAAVCGGLGLLARPSMPPARAHPFVLVVTLMAVDNVLWLLALSHDFAYTAVLYLVMLAAAVFFLSMPYVLAVVGASLIGWTIIAGLADEPDVFVRWGYTLFAAGVVAVIAQGMRLRTYTRLEQLRTADSLRIQREAEIRHLNDLHADRLRLLNLTAHQVASPLTPILLRLRALLSQHSNLNDSERAAVSAIERNARRLDGAMKDVVMAVGLPGMRLRTADNDVGGLLAEVVNDQAAADRVRLHIDGHLLAPVDRIRMQDALSRLLKAVRGSGPDADVIDVRARREPSAVVVRFERPGARFSAEQARDLFEPFSHVYDPSERTDADIGLGLFIARGHIEAHGGQVSGESMGLGGVALVCRVPTPYRILKPPRAFSAPQPA